MFRDPTDDDDLKDDWTYFKKNKSEHFTAFDGFCDAFNLDSIKIPERLYYLSFSSPSDYQIFLADPNKSLQYKINPETLIGDPMESERWHKKNLYHRL